ncbi:importin subunit beta-like [Drosophila obscura]|uniref:importin subunit beta-like n=1 Tax=Drosophila obscura TaxID=7282 RepID=UPI001BB0EDF4|nr:importin subunit beta-like [Drosophila obscura]
MTSKIMQLVSVLEQTNSTDKDDLLFAKNYLEEAAAGNMSEYFTGLSVVLVDTKNSSVARTAAGLQMKKKLIGKDARARQQKLEIWQQFPNENRELIKHNLLATLGTENTRPSYAAQCVALLAVIELPLKRWGTLIQTLLKNAVGEGSSELLRESALEAIGYICQGAQGSLTESQLKQMLSAIVRGMRGVEPCKHVRLAAATALFNSLQFTKAVFQKKVERNAIMKVVGEATVSKDKDICVAALLCLLKIVTLHNQLLEPYFELVTTRLLGASDRSDISQANLCAAVYEALIYMIRDSSPNCYAVVQRTIIVIFDRLNQAIQTGNVHLQALLCATLHSLLQKIQKVDAPQISDRIMNAMFIVLQLSAGKSTKVQEQALLVVSTVVDLLGVGFAKYMPIFKHFLIAGLKDRVEYRVCCASVGITSLLCRVLQWQMVHHCDEILPVLIAGVGDISLCRGLKPLMLAVIGLMAAELGRRFLKYLNMVLDIMRGATSLQRDRTNTDNDQYIVELRNNVLLGYTGILRGLKSLRQTGLLEPHLPHIAGFINRLAQDSDMSDPLMIVAVGFMGDLCTSFGPRLGTLFETVAITRFLAKGKLSTNPSIKFFCEWVQQEVDKITEHDH